MIPTYLYIANDRWFDFEQLMKDSKGNIIWWKKPKRTAKNDRVYMYLSGGTKAIKYEFLVVNANLTYVDAKLDYFKYLKDTQPFDHTAIPEDKAMVELKLVREIKNIDKTIPALMKKDGGILGMLMSHRELKPQSIMWIDKIK